MNRIFVTGIGTGVGKTIASAIITEALAADYWKPIQAGELEQSDTLTVKRLVSNSGTKFHNEAYRLSLAASPHLAAKQEHVEIALEHIHVPRTDNILVVEGAGGLMVPLNDNELIIDLIKYINAGVILVSRNYLGSINHTLLSIEAILNRGLPLIGIIFNGPVVESTEEIILKRTGAKMIGRIDQEKKFSKNVITKYAREFRSQLGLLNIKKSS